MRTTLQIIAALLLIGFTTSVWYGTGWLYDRMGTEFSAGFLTGAVTTILMGFFLHWLDKRLPRSTDRG